MTLRDTVIDIDNELVVTRPRVYAVSFCLFTFGGVIGALIALYFAWRPW